MVGDSMKEKLSKKVELDKAKGFINEFKAFIKRGNVLDLAVGVIIGGAFSKIISSVVDDMLMPLLGVVIGGIDFTELTLEVGDATIKYGNFLQNVIDFLIVAFCIFVFIKLINAFTRKEEKKEEPKAPKPSNEELLLTEIRDLLKEDKKKK